MYNTKATNSGIEFEKIPVGNYQAICAGVYGLGLQKGAWQGKETIKEKVRLIWEVNKKDENGDRFLISNTYTLSTHQNSTLRKDIEGWLGKAFTDQDIEEFDVSNMLGKQCLLNIIHNDNGYANVKSVAPLPAGMPVIIKDKEVPEGMLKKIQEIREKAVVVNTPEATDTEDEQIGEQAPF